MLLCQSPRPTAVHRRLLALAFLGWAFDFYDLILYTFLVGPITTELGLTHAQHSQSLGLSFVATAVGGIACGFLADRIGRRRVVAWTILLYSLGSLLSGMARSVHGLWLARIVTGIGVGGEWAAGHALIAETFPPAYRGRAGAILQSGAPIGVGLATLVGTRLLPALGWRACFLLSSATAVLGFVARAGMPESDLWERSEVPPFRQGITRLVAGDLRRSFAWALLLATVNGASYWLTYSWLPEYLKQRHLTLSGSGDLMLVIVAGSLAGYATFGWVSDALGRRPTFSVYSLTMALGLVGLTVLWDQLSGSGGLLTSAAMLVGIGTGTWSNFGPMLAELFPTPVRNTGMGLVFNLARGAQYFTPLAITRLEPRFGLAAGIGSAAIFAVIASALVWALPETRALALEDSAPSIPAISPE